MERLAVIFDTFDEAMRVHKQVFTMIIDKGYVTHRDFMNIIMLNNDLYKDDTYDMYGWTYLCGTTVEEFKGDKFIITMPEMIQLYGNRKIRR